MLEKASREELITAIKKQRQIALRYKSRFTEVRGWDGMERSIIERLLVCLRDLKASASHN